MAADSRVVILTIALFLSYLTVAMALPAVPVHVVEGLGFDNTWGGLAVGIAFLSTILTRGHAGAWSDRVGGKLAMQYGLLIYAAAGLVCALAAWPYLSVTQSYVLLLGGRLVLGLGESLALVGMMGWAIGLTGQARSGRVISLVGMGMYGAFAAVGPLGLTLLDRIGFVGLMVVCSVLPIVGLVIIQSVPAVEPHAGPRVSFWRIVGRIWRPGAAVGLQGVGFAALGAFFPLFFLSKGWPHAGLRLTFFGTGFVAMRLLCGHLPDRMGGTRVAAISLAVEALGQYLMASARALRSACGRSPNWHWMLHGLPIDGSVVIKRIPPQLRGTAIGGFAAFQDLAYGATGPVVGVIAHYSDILPSS